MRFGNKSTGSTRQRASIIRVFYLLAFVCSATGIDISLAATISDEHAVKTPPPYLPFESSPNQVIVQSSDWQAIPMRMVAQVSTVQERYDRTIARIDEALEAWYVKRPIVPGFDQSQDLILSLRKKAVQAYFDADYDEAVRLAGQALEEVELIHQKEEDSFVLNLDIAISAYESEKMTQAKEAIALALAMRPEHEEAIFWHERIEQLPDLIAARKDVLDAFSEGRLQDEINALYRVLNIKPKDTQTLSRIEAAKHQLQERRFAITISQGHQALQNRNLTKAKKALVKAQELKPGHVENNRLSQKISQAEREMKISILIEAAKKGASEDDWDAVQRTFEEILVIQPQLNDAIEGRDFARKIILAQRNLDDFVARPQRLNSANIAAAARKEIERVQPLLQFSPHMRSTVQALEIELEQWQQTVPVRVLSDGNTHIEVRGVGIIGVTVDRLVMLKPGTYQFEGKRKGYRNKLIEVRVSKDVTDMTEVKVICDEPT